MTIIKFKILKYFLSILIIIFFLKANGQLSLGDIVFTGMNTDGEDNFSFVLLNDFNTGDSIILTDNGWSNLSGFRSGESFLKIISNENLSCGEQITINGLTAKKNDGSSTGIISGNSLDLNNNGDQIFAFSGDKPTVSDMSNFIAVIHNNDGWNTSVTSTKSMKPSIFTDGVNSLVFSNHIDNMSYNCALTSSADLSLIRQFVNDESNWLLNNGQEFSLPNCEISCMNIPPSIICPSDTVIDIDQGFCDATFVFDEPLCFQNCIDVSINQIDLTGLTSEDLFPLGVTTLIYEVSNSLGSNTCSFDITVVDNEDPLIICPSDTIVYNSTSSCEVLVNYNLPIISDNCSSEFLTQIDFTGLTSGSLFPNGTTLLEYSVDDSHNNSASCEFEITILDTIVPIINNCPSNLIFPATNGNCEGQAFWTTPSAIDLCGSVNLLSTHSSGDFFPFGITNVTYYVEDLSGNIDSCSFTVEIVDSTAPNLNTISTRTITSSDGCSAIIPNYITLFSPIDNCPGAIDLIQKPSPGTILYGDTIISVIATDLYGNSDTSSFVLEVNNITPIINCPSSLNIYLNNDCNALVPDVSSNIISGGGCSGITFTQIPAVGSIINSNTNINFTASNISGVSSTCSISGILVDTIKPTIVCPRDTIVNTNSSLCLNFYDTLGEAVPSVSDNCMILFTENDYNSSSSIQNTLFNLGDYNIKWSVRDTANNVSECIQTISIVDLVKPNVTCIDTIKSIITSPNCEGNVNVVNPFYSDNCGIQSIINNITGTSTNPTGIFPLGFTTVYFTVSDMNGNDSTCSTVILVDDGVLPNLICGENDTSYNINSNCEAYVSVLEPVNNHSCNSVDFTVVNDYNNITNSSDFYPLGITDVEYTLTNFSGQTSTCTKQIVVLDTLKPSIICNDTIVYVDNSCFSQVSNIDPYVNDSCSYLISNDFNNSNSFDENLIVGNYSVIFTATDLSGNFENCISNILVIDTVSPTIICADTLIVYNSIFSCDTNLTLLPPAISDNCSIFSITNNYNNTNNASGLYPIDTTTVLWEVIDTYNNQVYCTEVIIVKDSIKPIFTLKPSDTIIYSNASECGIVYDYINSILPTDNCSLATFNKLAPLDFTGGDFLSLGDYIFSFEAEDFSGNEEVYNYTISILDTFDLELICPNDTIICDSLIVYDNYEIVSPCHEILNFTQISGPSSGTIVNPGTYNIIYEIEDTRNKTSQCNFMVDVSPVVSNILVSDTLLCDGSTSFSVIAESISNLEFGTWYSNDLNLQFNNNIEPITTINNLKIGENLMFWEVSNTKCSSTDSVVVVVDLSPEMIDDSIVSSMPKNIVVLDFKADGYESFAWNNTDYLSNPNSILTLASPENSTSYTLSLESEFGCLNSSTIYIEIPKVLYVENPTDFFTPNGDGVNDTWFLSEKVNEFNYKVTIYNRWGQRVFKDSNYINNWNGKSGNSELPEGTYYYEVSVNNQFYTGPISIKR